MSLIFTIFILNYINTHYQSHFYYDTVAQTR